MAGATRPVGGGAYSGPRSEPGGQNTPRAGRSVATVGTYNLALGTFWQQVDQGPIVDEELATGVVTSAGTGSESFNADESATGTVAASGSGIESSAHSGSATGTVTASGSGVDAYAYADTGSGALTASGTGVGSSYVSEVRADTPTGYWQMGETSGAALANDVAGGQAIALSGGATVNQPGATSALGRAVSFDGVDDYGRVASLDLSATDRLTIEMWLLWDVNGNDDDLALEHGESNQVRGWAIDPSSSASGGAWTAFLPGGGFTEERILPRPSAATWHHIVVLINRDVATAGNAGGGGALDFYVDGVNYPGDVTSESHPTDLLFANYPLMVMGRSAPGDGTKSLFGAGDMQHLAVYSYLLSPTRIQAHYDARLTVAGTESTTYNDSGSGTVTASGTGVESSAHSGSATGTVTTSGSGVESYGVAYNDSASGTLTASAPPGGGVHWSEDFEDGDMAGWNSPEEFAATFTAINEAGVGHDGGRGLHIVTDATGAGLRRYVNVDWAYTDTLLRFWLRVNNLPAFGSILEARDDSGQWLWQLFYDVESDQLDLEAYTGSGTTVGGLRSPIGSLPEDAWAYVEIRMKAEVAGKASLTLNSGTPVTYSGDLHRAVPLKQVQFWAERVSQDVVFDDLEFLHDPDATPESFTYNDSRTATVTASGSGVENFQPPPVTHTDSGTATVTASGTGVEAATYNDSGSGTATASGSASETSAHSASGTATTTASGSGVEAATYADSQPGTVTAGGSGVESFQPPVVYTDSGSATATASGTGVESLVYTDSGTATASASGTGAESAAYADARTAAATASGSGAESFTTSDSSSGLATASGTGTESAAYADSRSATATASGSGIEAYQPTVIYTDSRSGTVTVSGDGSDSYETSAGYEDSGTGTATATGTAVESLTRSAAASGAITASGTGAESSTHSPTATGAATASGTGVESATHATSATTTTTASGTGVESATYADAATATATASGSGAESYGVIYTDTASGAVIITGDGSESYETTAAYEDAGSGATTATGSGVESVVYDDSQAGVLTASGTGSSFQGEKGHAWIVTGSTHRSNTTGVAGSVGRRAMVVTGSVVDRPATIETGSIEWVTTSP